MVLNDQWVTGEITEEIKKINNLRQWKQKHDDPKHMRHSKSSSKTEVYSNTISPQETRKLPNKQSKFTPKATREGTTNKTQSLAEGTIS